MHDVAALFVATGGVYFGLPGVDPWDEARDARLYAGNSPVIAHPPCERWGRYWSGGPSTKIRRKLGDDGGCFSAAIAAIAAIAAVCLSIPRQATHSPITGFCARPGASGGRMLVTGKGTFAALHRGTTGIEHANSRGSTPSGLTYPSWIGQFQRLAAALITGFIARRRDSSAKQASLRASTRPASRLEKISQPQSHFVICCYG